MGTPLILQLILVLFTTLVLVLQKFQHVPDVVFVTNQLANVHVFQVTPMLTVPLKMLSLSKHLDCLAYKYKKTKKKKKNKKQKNLCSIGSSIGSNRIINI